MTQVDFYTCAVDQLLTPDDLAPWHEYAAGHISHFESLRRIFSRIRATPEQFADILNKMRFDQQASRSIDTLERHGWETIVVSNGCGWYIEQLFAEHSINVPLHTNPGVYDDEQGLQMSLPRESPYFSEEVGISKTHVVRDALESGHDVAFAGDGRPDLEPALLLPSHRRFARGWLAETLQERGETFVPFETWSTIAQFLCEEAD